MAVEHELRARMSGSTAISALVGVRVRPIPLPQEATLPAVTYQRVSTVREHASTTDPGFAHTRFQVDCWAETFAGALALRDEVNDRLSRWSSSTGSVTVFDVFQAGERAFYEEDREAQRVILDFMVHHTE